MWMHVIVVFSYAISFVGNAIIISGTIRNYPNILGWENAFQLQGIFQAICSFVSNLILLHLMDQFSKINQN